MRCCICAAPVYGWRVVVVGWVEGVNHTPFGPVPYGGVRVKRVPTCRAVYCAYRVRADAAAKPETDNADTP
jgi:hypothetical protein